MKRNQFRVTRPASTSLNTPPAPPVGQTFFPPKIQNAINAHLTPECTAEGARLHRHLHTAHDYIAMRQQPDLEITQGDRAVIQILIDSENTRQPELQLSYYPSLTAFAFWLESNKNRRKQHVRALVASAEDRHHHFYVDCYFTEPGQYSSLIFIESARIIHPAQQFVLSKFQDILYTKQVENFRIAVIDAQVQCSPADCVIFCLSFALKSLKHKYAFNNMHQQHCTHNYLHPHFDRISSMDFYVYPIFPGSLLPADFIRHTHSRSAYQNIFEKLPPIEREEATSRLNSLYQDRITAHGKTQYLVSIEHKRLQLLRRALIQMGAISLP